MGHNSVSIVPISNPIGPVGLSGHCLDSQSRKTQIPDPENPKPKTKGVYNFGKTELRQKWPKFG